MGKGQSILTSQESERRAPSRHVPSLHAEAVLGAPIRGLVVRVQFFLERAAFQERTLRAEAAARHGGEGREAGARRAQAGWTDTDLGLRRKSDGIKVRLLAQLRKETTMTLAWMTERLRVNTKTHLVPLLHRSGRREEKS
jgi:hypothetical protein